MNERIDYLAVEASPNNEKQKKKIRIFVVCFMPFFILLLKT